MNTMSEMSADGNLTKDSLDIFFRELGKQYRKLVGKNVPAELTVVGGAAVLICYGFREMTNDIDAVIQAGSAMKEAADIVRDKYGLGNNWLNSDFIHTTSYTDKLAFYSTYYKKFSNILTVRVIEKEYLISMKLMSGRIYKNDISDIIGILLSERNQGNVISLENIIDASEKLYGDWEKIPERSRIFIDSVYADNNLDELYHLYRNNELSASQQLDAFEKKYQGVLTKDNVNDVIAELMKRKETD